MRFEEALYQFVTELKRQYGDDDHLIKIAIHPEMMKTVFIEMSKNNQYGMNLGNYGDFRLFDIQIVPRTKDTF